MDKRNWKIVYNNYSGLEKKALELIYKEMSGLILRDDGVYTLHTLECSKAGCDLDKNAVIIGVYSENEIFSKYITEDEIPADGYVVKVINNPENEDLKLALITGNRGIDVFYGAVDFVDDYFVSAIPHNGAVPMSEKLFEAVLPDYYKASAPKVKTRGVFSWGHPINDYRNYIENMARLKLNQLILWNDFVPLNADDVVDCAHEYGIELLWGYAWGWDTDCKKTDITNLDKLSDEIVSEYERNYSKIKGDGIYFQSFTELAEEYIGDRLIADAVVELVNMTAQKLLKKYPELHLQFGLHAMSVKNRLNFIEKVDRRVEILWEDCGSFPYDYYPVVKSEEEYKNTVKFTDDIIALRDFGRTGLVFKGYMVMDWSRFVNQSGRFVLGNNSEKIIKHDIDMLTPAWHNLYADWFKNGKYLHDMINHVVSEYNDGINLCMAGLFSGGIWLPQAVSAEMMWNCDGEYEDILNRVYKRRCIMKA